MFSITRLNIQWGTRSATCEKMGHSRAHCPFRSREGPFQPLQWSLRSALWVLHERRMRALPEITTILFKFRPKLQVKENIFIISNVRRLIPVHLEFFSAIYRPDLRRTGPTPSRPGSAWLCYDSIIKVKWSFYRVLSNYGDFYSNLLLFWFPDRSPFLFYGQGRIIRWCKVTCPDWRARDCTRTPFDVFIAKGWNFGKRTILRYIKLKVQRFEQILGGELPPECGDNGSGGLRIGTDAPSVNTLPDKIL